MSQEIPYTSSMVKKSLRLDIQQQPDDYTCGPTCLHAIYNYHNDSIRLGEVIDEIPQLKDGGTLGVLLATHALSRGYSAIIYTYNLNVFDPTWFELPVGLLAIKLEQQLQAKSHDEKLIEVITAYLNFIKTGGEIRFKDLNAGLIRHYMKRKLPILTGLSSTYLYRSAREIDQDGKLNYDDINGVPTGHFVVLSGYDIVNRRVTVADPYSSNPKYSKHYYQVKVERLVNSILLGILTYDANLVVIEPKN